MNKRIYILLLMILILLFFPIVSFSINVNTNSKLNTIIINNTEDLSNAIANQKPNQIWKIKEGIYDLTEIELNKYKDWKNPETSSQGGWYFPIYEDNITIIGEGDVTITSSVESENGTWATQDFLSIWGDNITINNIDFKSKRTQNKAIEIMGKNFTLKNSTIKDLSYGNSSKVFSGSIYFTPLNSEKDIGNCLLQNVYIFAYISASQAKKGNVDISNLTLNFTNNVWSEWGEGYGPSLIGNVYRKLDNITYIVDNTANWNELLSLDYIYNEDTKPGTIIKLSEDIKLNKSLTITRNDITIDLNSHKIAASNNFSKIKDNQNHLVILDNVSNVIIKNGIIETNNSTKNGITISNSKDIMLENMTINNQSSESGGIPLAISNSKTTIKGNLELHVNNNHSHGINISSTEGETALVFEDNSYVSLKGKDTLTIINIEGSKENINITGAINAGLELNEDGNFIKHNHTFSNTWTYDENYHWKECECSEIVDKAKHLWVWIIDKESTTTSVGFKHEECSICGYKKEKIEMSLVGISNNFENEDKTEEEKENSYTNFPEKNNNVNSNYITDTNIPNHNISIENEILNKEETIKNNSNKALLIVYIIIIIIITILLIIIIIKNKKMKLE